MIIRFFFLFLIFACTFCSSDEPKKDPDPLSITSFKIDGQENLGLTRITDVGRTSTFEITFSAPIDPVYATVEFVDISGNQPLAFELSDDQTKLVVIPTQPLAHLTRHLFWISMDVKGTRGETLGAQFSQYFYTEIDPTPKRPVLPHDDDSDNDNTNDLLSVVQQQTFKYFWDFAHPASGMARERNTSGNTVTSGGTGFGIMSIIVGMERNFITRIDGVERMNKIVSFLETADRFHGVW